MGRSEKHPRLTRDLVAPHFGGPWLSIGDHTYGGLDIQSPGDANLSIGRYTSIADHVVVILANHRTDTVTSYPFRVLAFLWPEASKFKDHRAKGVVSVGSDVWIGYRSIILPGVTIGDGAVIGAGSIVTKDVPPYAIVAGNPAKVLRYRFPAKIIKELLRIRWWDWDDEQVAEAIPHLLADDASAFVQRFTTLHSAG